MKKPICIVLCLFMLIALGCAKNDPAVTPDGTASPAGDTETPTAAPAAATDEPGGKSYRFDYRYSAVGAFGSSTYILETDDSVYYLFNGILYYSDKEYKDFMPLCGKPECAHDSPDCDAYIDPIGGFWIYGDHIYYVSDNLKSEEERLNTFNRHAYLWRLKLNGTAHEEVLRLPEHDFGFTPEKSSWFISFQDKYMLINYAAYEKYSDTVCYGSWGVLTLDDMKYAERGAEKQDPLASLQPDSLGGLFLSGDGSLMYELNSYQNGEKYKYRLTSYDFETNDHQLIAELDAKPEYLDGAFCVCGDEFMYISYNGDDRILSFHMVDFGTGEDRLIAEGTIEEYPVHLYDWVGGYIYGIPVKGSLHLADAFYVYDSDLRPVNIISYEGLPEEMRLLRAFLQTDSYIFAAPMLYDEYGEPMGVSLTFALPTWYIDKSEIGTENLAWHRWAPEG